MMMNGEISIIPFQPADQPEAKALILSGLVEHWGFLDPTLNPDLNDIAHSYASGLFLVARQRGRMIGTGAFLPCDEQCAQITRMSVASDLRRTGVGGMILKELCDFAKKKRYQKLILETTSTWKEVILFYLHYGFKITHQKDGDTYFELMLK